MMSTSRLDAQQQRDIHCDRFSARWFFLSVTGRTSTTTGSRRRQSPGTEIGIRRERLQAEEMDNNGNGQQTTAGNTPPKQYEISRAAMQSRGALQGAQRAQPQLGARRPRSGTDGAPSPNSRSGAAQRIGGEANMHVDVSVQNQQGYDPIRYLYGAAAADCAAATVAAEHGRLLLDAAGYSAATGAVLAPALGRSVTPARDTRTRYTTSTTIRY